MRHKTVSIIAAILVVGLLAIGAVYFTDWWDTGSTTGIGNHTSSNTSTIAGSIEGWHVSSDIDAPTDNRYINAYKLGEPPVWIPESEFSPDNYSVLIHEVTRYPGVRPTEEQLDEAWELYNESYEAAERNGWFDIKEGIQDGYKLEANNHYINVDGDPVFHRMGDPNPYNPPVLMYYTDPRNSGRKILVGYMYHQPISTDREGRQMGGPLTVWHHHPDEMAPYPSHFNRTVSMREDMRTTEDLFAELETDIENVSEYIEERNRTAEMMHTWFIEHPEGPFASRMTIPSEYLEAVNGSKPGRFTEEEFKRYAMREYYESTNGSIVRGG